MHLWRSATWKANRNCVRNYFPSKFIAFFSIWFDKGAFIGRRQKSNNRRRKTVKNLWRAIWFNEIIVGSRKKTFMLLVATRNFKLSSLSSNLSHWTNFQRSSRQKSLNLPGFRLENRIQLFLGKSFSSTPWLPLAKTCFRQTRASDRLLAFLSFEKFHNLSTSRLSLRDDISMKCERRKT